MKPFDKIKELEKGCGKYETRGAYTFTCGKSSKAGKIQLCNFCKSNLKLLKEVQKEVIKKIEKCKIHTFGVLILIEKKELLKSMREII